MSFHIGQRVRFRKNPAYTPAGSIPDGAEGIIIDGPLKCAKQNDSGLRYMVRFDCGIEQFRIQEVLEPIDSYDGRQACEWEQCIWRPNTAMTHF